MKKINIEDIKRATIALWHRFPEAIVYLTCLTIWSLMNVWNVVETLSDTMEQMESAWCTVTVMQNVSLYYFFSIAAVLSVVLRFWGEEVQNKQRFVLVGIVAYLLLMADTVFLWTRPEELSVELILAHVSCITALLIGGVFLPFFREKDDLSSWNLALRMTLFAVVCSWTCCLLSGGVDLLLGSLDLLFGIDIDSRWYSTVVIIFCIWLAMMLWMSRLPEGEKKFDRVPVTSKFLTGMVRYLLLPLVLGYLVVLYVYAAKILIAFELPKGGVCWYVTILMSFCLAYEFLLYPLQCKVKAENGTSHTFERKVIQWLPVIILPLLLLMSVAIGRRISDYGITVSRLYMVTLNLWFYVVCIGLWLTRARRIHWISLSFAFCFLLTSVLPVVNFCNISRVVILDRIEQHFASHEHPELPMDEKSYDTYMKSLPWEEAEKLQDELEYVYSMYDRKQIERYVTKDVYFYQSYRPKDVEKSGIEYYYNHNSSIEVPEGYSHFDRFCPIDISVNANDSTIWRLFYEDNDSLTFVIDVEQLPDSNFVGTFMLEDVERRGVLCVDHLSINPVYNDSVMSWVDLQGYFFTK